MSPADVGAEKDDDDDDDDDDEDSPLLGEDGDGDTSRDLRFLSWYL